ncbi:hypothetical protein GRI72_04990 [Altererythrobacter marinus]|uniref:Tetratricopeptide repeat protein n=1 Tax=Pelagerythrobacter marinus TaxID=538382 RepID=A0ABW9UX66_9SPHN|nr:hypothetical protein [Pelagerythrobacter marinus]MXO68180.1 hypothetical protein [Pelagerythrobacter marinus]
MQSFVRNPNARRMRIGSHFALALALVAGGVVGATALEAPAAAQKKKDNGKPNYTKGFIEAYQPLAKRIEAQEDPAALKAEIPTITAAVESEDDKFVAGQAIYTIGTRAKDTALQRQGLDMMLESGKVGAENLGLSLFASGQLAYNAEDYAKARERFEEAAAAGYDDPALQGLMAESYFAEENYDAGLATLKQAISTRHEAGQTVEEDWIKRGFAIAYNNQLAEHAADFAEIYLRHYPSANVWGDAIAVQRSFFEYDDQELLDLMRLSDRTGSLRSERDYVDYISAADARRLPAEVGRVVEAGLAANMLNPGDVLVTEAKATAQAQAGPARADVAQLAQDARGSGATALDAAAAGDMYLNFGDTAEAIEMYELALTRPGVDRGRVLIRLGIAQADQGQYAEAKANFDKVEGERAMIADLWSIYAEQQMSAGATAQ